MRSPRIYALGDKIWGFFVYWWERFASYFTDRTPNFRTALVPMIALSSILYMRWIETNFIFDEQEALLGNPYLSQQYKYEDAIYRDFWGLPCNASIGSYRPVPNYVWRSMVEAGERGQRLIDKGISHEKQLELWQKTGSKEPLPTLTEKGKASWPQHLFNLLFHGVNGALFVAMGFRVTRRKMAAWFAGTTFVSAAILTEAVSGVVGLADVLGGLGALLALAALGLRAYAMPFAVFLATLLGLFSKESAIVCIPLVPVAAVLSAPLVHREKPARLVRGALATVGVLTAFILYTELRKRWFPNAIGSELSDPLPLGSSMTEHAARDFLIWFHQAPLPKDPLNNPLVDAPPDFRVAGALRVYFRGLIQVFFPWHLSGDYSAPQEPIPTKLLFTESVLGGAATLLPLGAALGLWLMVIRREIIAPQPIIPFQEPQARVSEPAAGRISRVLARMKQHRVGAWLDDNWVVIRRRGLELLLVLFTVWFTRKMLGVGPGAMNKDLADNNPEHNIVMPDWLLQDILAYSAFGCVAFGCFVESSWKPRTQGRFDWAPLLCAIGLVWVVVSYFPHSNMYVLLPTVRAERLWYFPVIGTTILIAVGLTMIVDKMRSSSQWRSRAWMVPAAFLGFQAGRAYLHASDYRDDLIFWRETKDSVPNSSKAHLNYSVMAGARGQMEIRLQESHIARNLAPDWAMAHIYTGDTLCRMGRVDESWPHYARGFELGPNDKGLISLALQCLWDTKKLKEHETELRAISNAHPGSWLAHLANDTLVNGDKQGGVKREDKPRSYNEGIEEKNDAESTETSTDTTSTGTEVIDTTPAVDVTSG